ncbi:hypothetical protein VZT92_004230 [Zoarces viviparus]|uniref:Uncharacterized protein n=1 Tax=Zoarces viviparus TaxID=48416 RepID=A0AAW1FXZ6_ZOAVI
MEESYETFEEELRPPRADPPPQKPVRQILRPEMYAPRKVREEKSQFSQQPRAEPKMLPREPSSPRTTALRKASSSQNLTQIETPWENVTLNRCLFVAITILVLTSGFQRLHETLRGHGAAEEEEVGLTVRRAGKIQHRRQPPEPETSLWEVMLWWLPDLDDEEDEEDDDDDDDEQVKIEKSKRGATARASRGLRNKPPPDKKLMKQREGKFKERRAKKPKDEEIKEKKEEPEAAADEDEGKEEAEFEKKQKLEGKKEKKKTPKG